jgi:opacity protein-like surface antigen
MSAKNKLLVVSGAVVAGMTATPAFADGGYFGGFVGGISPDDFNINDADELSADTGIIFGGVLGTRFSEYMRAEVEASYWSGDADCAGKCGDLEYDLSSLSILGNAWFDFNGDMGFTPYVGGGIGGANVSLESDSGDAEAWALAYQAGLGARFGGSGMTFDIGYRYKVVSVDQGDLDDHPLVGDDIDLNSHVVQIGGTWEY